VQSVRFACTMWVVSHVSRETCTFYIWWNKKDSKGKNKYGFRWCYNKRTNYRFRKCFRKFQEEEDDITFGKILSN